MSAALPIQDTGESVNVTVSMSATLPAPVQALAYTIGEGALDVQRFIDDVQRLVCAKINTVPFNLGPTGKVIPSLSPSDLSAKRQSQPYAVARHMCNFIFYNHPYSKGAFSSLRLGELFRRDHTTVFSSLKRMRGFIERRHLYARLLQEVCNDLARLGYPQFFIFNNGWAAE